MPAIIEATNVSKKFMIKNKEFWALKNVSFSVGKGEIFGLLGPNGAGKTTIMNIILGLLVQDYGTVKVFGKDLLKNRELMEKINNASGNTNFHWALRPRDVLRFYAMVYNVPKEKIESRIDKLEKFFGGIESLDKLPSMMFIADLSENEYAAKEARLKKIPVMGFLNTDTHPKLLDHAIPCNDRNIASIKLVMDYLVEAALEGKKQAKSKVGEIESKEEKAK